MSWIDQAQDHLGKSAIALKAVETIGKLAKKALDSQLDDIDSSAVFKLISGIVDSLIAGFDGKISKEEIEKQIEAMLSRRNERDAKFDRLLDEKFDKEPTP